MNYLFGMLASFAIIFFFFLVIVIAFYILKSIGLYKLAEKKGITNPWFAWIPFLDLYLLGLLVKKINIGTLEIDKLELVLPIAELIYVALLNVAGIGFLIMVVFAVLLNVTLYKLYLSYSPKNAVVWAVFSVILSLWPIFIFLIRDTSPVNLINKDETKA